MLVEHRGRRATGSTSSPPATPATPTQFWRLCDANGVLRPAGARGRRPGRRRRHAADLTGGVRRAGRACSASGCCCWVGRHRADPARRSSWPLCSRSRSPTTPRRGTASSSTFASARTPPATTTWLESGVFAPLNRVWIAVVLGVVPEVLIDGVITHHQLRPSRRAGPVDAAPSPARRHLDARPGGAQRRARQPAGLGDRDQAPGRLPAVRPGAGGDPDHRRAARARADPAPAGDRPGVPPADGRAQRLRLLRRAARRSGDQHAYWGPENRARPAAAGADPGHGRVRQPALADVQQRRAGPGRRQRRVRRPDHQAQGPDPAAARRCGCRRWPPRPPRRPASACCGHRQRRPGADRARLGRRRDPRPGADQRPGRARHRPLRQRAAGPPAGRRARRRSRLRRPLLRQERDPRDRRSAPTPRASP